MLRKFVVILTMLLCSMATQLYALGLGTVTVESALNQPLHVQIELLQLGDTRLQDVRVQMASNDDFQRFNIEREGFLSNVRFSVEPTSQGNVVILTSSQVVREPYLSFVLETRWPNGRLLSEHTILLDLPVFDEQQSVAEVRKPISPILQRPTTQPDAEPFVEAAIAAPAAVTPITASAANLQPEQIAPAAEVEEIQQQAVDAESVAEPKPEQFIDPEPEQAAEPEQQEQITEAEPEPATVTDAQEQAGNDAPEAVEAEVEIAEPAEEVLAEAAEDEAPVEEVAVSEEQVIEDEPEAAAVEEVEEEVEEATEAIPELEETQEVETLETDNTDTLSDIALQVRPDNSVSMQQTMLAIQRLNPEAFADSNINRLKSGQVLRIPTLEEIKVMDPREAVNEVARQNQDFAIVDVQPLAAPSDAAPAEDVPQQGQLSVVSVDDAIDATAGSSELGQAENEALDQRIAELEAQLAQRQEDVDRARIEREEMSSRMADLEEQIVAAQEIIRLQDIQLAQLQESLVAAAAEAALAAEQQAIQAAAEAEAAQPVPSSSTLFDDVLRILAGNSVFMIFGVILVILLLVALLLRRNRAAKLEGDDDEIDAIAEQELGSENTGETAVVTEDEEKDEAATEFQDYDASELDSELDDIIDVTDDETQSDAAVDADEEDEQGPGKESATEPLHEEPSEEVANQESETKSFLDDLGIGLDSFDYDDEEDAEKTGIESEAKPESSAEEPVEEVADTEASDPDDSDDALTSEELVETEEEADSFEFSLDDTSNTIESEANDAQDLDIDTLEFDVEEEPAEVKIESDSEEDLDLETFSFDDEIEFDIGEEPEPAADTAKADDELDFLLDDDAEIGSVDDVEEVELLSDDDEAATKLELAYAYHKMGDTEGAKEILQEVLKEGSDEQIEEANKLHGALDGNID